MDEEFDPMLSEEHDYATRDDSSSFDIALPEQPVQLKAKPERIICRTRAGTEHIVALIKPNIYHDALFLAFATGLQSDWFINHISDISKPGYHDQLRNFFDWLNDTDHQTTDINRYDCLKDYESYKMNHQGFKKSPLGSLKQILAHGLDSPFLSDKDIHYLEALLELTKIAEGSESESYTLSEWFSIPWLRPIIGEKYYLQLESPRRLLVSFRVTIAVTLLYLLEARQQWQKFPAQDFDTSYNHWQYNWDRLLIKQAGRFDENGEPADSLTQVLWQDIIKPSWQCFIKAKLLQPGTHKFIKKYTVDNKGLYPWQKPILFHPDYHNHYSPLEELLLAYLAACETIQPTDIPKLKTSDYALETKTSGRLIMMECQYYKGRAGSIHQPAIIMASDSWTQALYRYRQGLPCTAPLFKTKIRKRFKMPVLGKNNNRHTQVEMLFKLWKIPTLQRRIHSELERAQASPIFLKAMLALEEGSELYRQFNKRTGGCREDYASEPFPIPKILFSLTHIKNTAVHAGSDNYRESDLINHHSHTSETEKHAYLTDNNKDFVNRLGRITRLVLHDLQNVVYQPSIGAIQQAVNDLETRTQVVEATGVSDANVQSLQETIDQDDMGDDIIVADTLDSALYFIHYIDQAEQVVPRLLAVRPDFVERTLLIQVEWMTRTLSRMRQAKAAKKKYASLCEHLPTLFDHLLDSTE